MMELREAIEEVRNEPDFNYGLPLTQAIETILNAVTDGTLIPADAVFQVKDGYRITAQFPKTIYEDCGVWDDVPLSEALEIRSADEVRREAILEVIDYLVMKTGASQAMLSAIRALIDTPQPKSDPNCPECKGSGLRDSGGVYPWGEGIFVSCDCDKQPKGGDDE